MADSGKLIFPVKFDLDRAVTEAMGDSDRILQRLQTAVNNKPIVLSFDSSRIYDIRQSPAIKQLQQNGIEVTVHEKGSLSAMRVEMTNLASAWSELSEKQRIFDQESGKYTQKALEILNRYSELTAATESYAKSLSAIVRESRQLEKAEQKRAEKEAAHRAAMSNSQNSIKDATYALRYYKKMLEETNMYNPDGSIAKKWNNIANIIQHLTTRLEDMKAKVAESTVSLNKLREEEEKANAKLRSDELKSRQQRQTEALRPIEQERAARQKLIEQKKQEMGILAGEEKTIEQVNRKLQLRQRMLERADPNSSIFKRNADEIIRLNAILDKYKEKIQAALSAKTGIASMPERSITQVMAKIEAYRNVMQNADFGSKAFTIAMTNAGMLTTKLERMNKEVARHETWRVFKEAMNSAANTLESLNARLSAWQNRMQSQEIGSRGWQYSALQISRLSQELQRATQYAQDFQQKAFQGLRATNTNLQVSELQKQRAELERLNIAYNELNTNKKAFDANGNLTSDAVRILQQRAAILTQITGITRDADSAQEAYNKKLADEEAKLNRLIESEAKRRKHLQESLRIMQANERRIEGINQKLQRYQQLIAKQLVGSAGWNESALAIRRLSEELTRANQHMADFQQKAFKGLSSGFTANKVEELQRLRVELEGIDMQFNSLYQNGRATNPDGSWNDRTRALLNDRLKKEQEIAKILTTASEEALKLSQKSTEEAEKRRKIIQETQRKQKEHDAAKGERRALAIAEQRRKAAGQLTKEQEKRQRMLNAENNTITNIQQKLSYLNQKLQGQQIGSNGFLKTAEQIRELNKLLEEAQKKINLITSGKTSSAIGNKEIAFNKVSTAVRTQTTYVERLIKRLALYASIGALGSMAQKIRETTAQFELQRISLGAIIQDQNRANMLFSEIKQFALQSPVSVLDLTKYTKQVAAYRIETEKLFDTTKRLADVAVGLGVDMGRIVLAYGQVRAASYLRAAEIRQFTEAGIPMLELLSEKLTKMNGELVTTEQVMDIVSKRGIDFKMVEEVFNDMTSAGGLFYNMQEKQGNTLYGLWAKLGDAAQIMYDEIGNSGVVNSAMKGFITLSSDLMRNWHSASIAIGVMTASMGILMLKQRMVTIGMKQREMAEKRVQSAIEMRQRAEGQLARATVAGNVAEQKRINKILTRCKAEEKAAITAQENIAKQSTLNTGGRAMMSSLLSSVGWGMALAAVGTFVYKIGEAIETAHRLKNKLKETFEETSILQAQSVRNFETLVQKALSAADGSKTQKDALDELNRTYKNMLPEEALKIENLRTMGQRYDELTQAVRRYIAVEQEKKALNTINEEEGATQVKMQKRLREVMIDKKLGTVALSEEEVQRFFMAFREEALDTSKDIKQQFVAAFQKAGLDGAEKMWDAVKSLPSDALYWNPFAKLAGNSQDMLYYAEHWGAIGQLSSSIARQTREIEAQQKAYKSMTGDFGVYTQELVKYHEWVENNLNSGETFLQNQENVNNQVRAMASQIYKALKGAKIAWENNWADIIESVDPNQLNKVSYLNFQSIIEAIDPNKHPELYKYISEYRRLYNELIPQDPTVQQIRAKLFSLAESTGAGMDKMRAYLWDGSGSVDDYIKKLNDQIDNYEKSIKKMTATVANQGILGTITNFFFGDKIKESKKILEALRQELEFAKKYTIEKSKNKSGGKQDSRLQSLQEINQTLEKINKEYDDLRKKEGNIKALQDIKTQFKNTLDYTNKIGAKFGLKFDYPISFESLQEYRRRILKVMKGLKNLKGGEKAILEFETVIGKADSDKLQHEIEEQLKIIADRISRTKTAKDFYAKVLSMTGNYQLADAMTENLFDETGYNLEKQLADQVRSYFSNSGLDVKIPLNVIWSDDSINYKNLESFIEKYKDWLGQDVYDKLIKIARDGQNGLAKTYEGYLQDLKAAQDYSAKRIELARTTANKIREIELQMRSGQIGTYEGKSLIRQFLDKESQEGAKLELEAFKESPLYVQMFQNLEEASSTTLKMMKARLNSLSGLWNSMLSPTQLKELQSRINEIDEQLRKRNPFSVLRQSYLEYRNAVKDLTLTGSAKQVQKASEEFYNAGGTYGADSQQTRLAERELNIRRKIHELAKNLVETDGKRLKGAKAIEAMQRKSNDNLQIARGLLQVALEDEQDAINKAVSDNRDPEKDPAVIAAHKRVEAAQQEVVIAQQVADVVQTSAQKAKNLRENLLGAADMALQYLTMTSDIARAVASTMEALGADEFDVAYFNDIADSISDITAGIQGIISAATSLNIAGIISNSVGVIPNMIKGFTGLFSAGKVRKANKEIARQEKLLEQLEYTYSRLTVAMDKSFGSDYVSNYNQQLRLMQAEAEAYRKQAEAESSKGKKADKDKVTEYENKWRETLDKISDMQGELASKMLGSDIISMARDFASAWLEAYKSFSKTSDKMSEKFRDMIENMVVEGVLARVMQQALTPMFDMIDNMSDRDFYSVDFWKKVAEQAKTGSEAANYGATTVMKYLEQAGINIRELGGDLTGIQREYATASEESINGLAAATNTNNYYVSQILQELQYVRKTLETGRVSNGGITVTYPSELMEIERQGLQHLQMIERNTAETVIECRNLTIACNDMRLLLKQVIDRTGKSARMRVAM
ncbi:MAG: hypothetical protein HDS14_00520 [Bacteroides sp.]|nr:hypothetical protein [Bacteroides sp.]